MFLDICKDGFLKYLLKILHQISAQGLITLYSNENHIGISKSNQMLVQHILWGYGDCELCASKLNFFT